MTSPPATRPTRPDRTGDHPATGGGSPLRHWPWAVLTVALVGLLAIGWSATAWFPEQAARCASPECTSTARTQVALHWVGTGLVGLLAVGALWLGLRSRPSTRGTAPARLSPLWHGAVVGIVVVVLAMLTLWPTVRVGLLSPPLGVAALALEWALLTVLLDRMHLAARPASAPRRRLGAALLVAGAVVLLEVLLPLLSPFRALSVGMLQIALVQAGSALVLTTWLSLRDPAAHGDPAGERRAAVLACVLGTVGVVTIAVTGLHLRWSGLARLGEELLGLVAPW